jgi:hypothetical protein
LRVTGSLSHLRARVAAVERDLERDDHTAAATLASRDLATLASRDLQS